MLIHGATDNDVHPPVFGGPQRTFGLYRGLARRHHVRLLCVVPNRNRGAREERVQGVALARRSSWYTSVAWRLETWRLAPMLLAAHGHRVSAGRLLEALPGEADVFAADLHLTPLFERHPAPIKVYASHNVEADHFRMTGATRAAGFWSGRVRAFEGRAVERADLTLVTGADDAMRMTELYGVSPDRLEIVPNGFDETRVGPADEATRFSARSALGVQADEYACLFVGSDFPHNRDALRHLVDVVMPLLGRSGFRLMVAGGVARMLEGRREPWLTARAHVADLEPWLAAADAGVNPVETGGGSNVKLPTYLGAGIAALSTPFGMRGFESLAPWVTRASRSAFAEAIRSRPLGWARAGLTIPTAVAAHSWGTLGERLGETLQARRSGPVVARRALGGGRSG